MLTLEWSASHAVFVTEIDDEHVEIFQALSALQTSLATEAPPSTIRKHSQALATQIKLHPIRTSAFLAISIWPPQYVFRRKVPLFMLITAACLDLPLGGSGLWAIAMRGRA
jgi:hypothetical protein